MKIENRRVEEQERKRQNRRIRQGDQVQVISGNCRGMVGTVLKRKEDSFVVQGVNMRKRHMKKTRDQAGTILTVEKPIHASNLRLHVEGGKAVRLKMHVDADGNRTLVYRKDGQQKEYRPVKQPARQ